MHNVNKVVSLLTYKILNRYKCTNCKKLTEENSGSG
jgi:hypothetical protein